MFNVNYNPTIFYYEIFSHPLNKYPRRFVGCYNGPAERMSCALDALASELRTTLMARLANVQLVKPVPNTPRPVKGGRGSFINQPLILRDVRRMTDPCDGIDPKLLRGINDLKLDARGFPMGATELSPQEGVVIGRYQQHDGRETFVAHPRSCWDALEFVKSVDGETKEKENAESV